MSGTQRFDPDSADPAEPDPWLGCVVGERYRIEQRIGQGGMGVVYRGQHLDLGKRVAIKRLDARIASDPTAFERFRREAIAASRIESPHVVHVFDWGKAADGAPYLVMELLEGRDLRGLFQQEGRLSPEQATAIIGQVLRALMRTHHAGIVHRDLKPENIYLCSYDAEPNYVKLLDFGISKSLRDEPRPETVTRRGVIVGTASYMSPEQARGDTTLDARSDLYSVGAILYEALTGRVPHRGRTYEATLIQICTRDADDLRLHAPLVPEALAQLVARALARDPAQRFQTAKEFFEALSTAVPSTAARDSDPPLERFTTRRTKTALPAMPTQTKAREWRAAFWVAGLVLVALVAGLAFWGASSKADLPVLPSATPGVFPPTAVSTPSTSSPTSSAAELPSESVQPTALPRDGKARTDSPATAAASGTRSVSPRPNTSTKPSSSAANDSPGVAPGLKLRRTMP